MSDASKKTGLVRTLWKWTKRLVITGLVAWAVLASIAAAPRRDNSCTSGKLAGVLAVIGLPPVVVMVVV